MNQGPCKPAFTYECWLYAKGLEMNTVRGLAGHENRGSRTKISQKPYEKAWNLGALRGSLWIMSGQGLFCWGRKGYLREWRTQKKQGREDTPDLQQTKVRKQSSGVQKKPSPRARAFVPVRTRGRGPAEDDGLGCLFTDWWKAVPGGVVGRKHSHARPLPASALHWRQRTVPGSNSGEHNIVASARRRPHTD